MDCSIPGLPVHHQLLEFTQTHVHWSVMPSNHLILCHPLLLLPSIFPSIRIFSSESVLHIRWTKYWSFRFSISPSNEYSGLISFRWTGWISLLSKELSRVFSNTTVENINSLVLSFLYSPLSRRYMTTGKTTALTRQTFVGKVMSLLFNTLSRLVITFLPRSKRLLISWLQSPSAMILEPQNIKSASLHCFSIYLSWSNGTRCLIFVFWILSFKQTFSLSSFTFIKRLFSYSLSAIRVVSSAYLRLLIFLPAILIPAYASSSPEFLMMYSAYKLNKQCDNIQPWCTPFPIWNQSLLFHVQF